MKKIIFSTLLAISFCACTKETINYQNPVPGENGTEATPCCPSIENTLSRPDGQTPYTVQEPGRKSCSQCQHKADWNPSRYRRHFVKGEADKETSQLTLSCAANQVDQKTVSHCDHQGLETRPPPSGHTECIRDPGNRASENNFHLAAKGELSASFV